eukprot:scaffold3594_cov133-Isochrysis_galbana.AAC.2
MYHVIRRSCLRPKRGQRSVQSAVRVTGDRWSADSPIDGLPEVARCLGVGASDSGRCRAPDTG